MIHAIVTLLLCQLAGEATARALHLPLPGPVLGLLLLLAAFGVIPGLADRLRPVVQGLHSHLSLLFVPAGVGVVGHMPTFVTDGPALLLALLGSTVLAIIAGALTFAAVARLTGTDPRQDPPQ